MQEFYEFLAEMRIIEAPDAVDEIGSMDASALRRMAEDCFWLVNQGATPSAVTDLFSFAANGAMSGGAFPCSSVQCRLKRAHRLGVFAALYANRVYLPNLFEYGYHQKLNLRSTFAKDQITNQLIGDVAVYMQYKPLIESGLVDVIPSVVAVCPHCLKQLLMEEEEISSRVDAATRRLDRELAGRLTFTLGRDSYVTVDDPEELLDEPAGFIARRRFVAQWLRKAPYKFTEPEIRKLGLRRDILGVVTDDLLLQKWGHYAEGTSYLTSRKLDSIAIELVKPGDAAGSSLPRTLEHMLPMPPDLDVRRAIRFRAAEPEIFENYRTTVGNLVRTASTLHDADVADAIHSEVDPELAKISVAMRKRRRPLGAQVGRGLVFTAITAGVIERAGLFGSDSMETKAAAALLAAAAATGDAVRERLKAPAVPDDVASNPFYFLWKVGRP